MPTSAQLQDAEDDNAELRAAAADCSRAADDYEHEGFGALAARFREHAAALWRIAGTRTPPRRAPRKGNE